MDIERARNLITLSTDGHCKILVLRFARNEIQPAARREEGMRRRRRAGGRERDDDDILEKELKKKKKERETFPRRSTYYRNVTSAGQRTFRPPERNYKVKWAPRCVA